MMSKKYVLFVGCLAFVTLVVQQTEAVMGSSLFKGGYEFHFYNDTQSPVDIYFDVKSKGKLKEESPLAPQTVLDVNARGWIVNKILISQEFETKEMGLGQFPLWPVQLKQGQVIDPEYQVTKLDHKYKYFVISDKPEGYPRFYAVSKEQFKQIAGEKRRSTSKWEITLDTHSRKEYTNVRDDSKSHTPEQLPQGM